MNTTDLEKSLSPEVWRLAKGIVPKYSVLIKPEKEGGFFGVSPEFPTAFGRGKTPNECYKDTQESLVSAIGVMINNGKIPPQPGSPSPRTVQINVKFNDVEERVLSGVATTLGFRGIGGLLRDLAVNKIKKTKAPGLTEGKRRKSRSSAGTQTPQ